MLQSVWKNIFRIFSAWLCGPACVQHAYLNCLTSYVNVCYIQDGHYTKAQRLSMTISVAMKEELKKNSILGPGQCGRWNSPLSDHYHFFQHLDCLAMMTVLLTHFLRVKAVYMFKKSYRWCVHMYMYRGKPCMYIVCCTLHFCKESLLIKETLSLFINLCKLWKGWKEFILTLSFLTISWLNFSTVTDFFHLFPEQWSILLHENEFKQNLCINTLLILQSGSHVS